MERFFRGRYNARLLHDYDEIIKVSRYIYRNPEVIIKNELDLYPWSSNPLFFGQKKIQWVNKKELKKIFNSTHYRELHASLIDYFKSD